MITSLAELEVLIQQTARVLLFLDYDGTLAEFAPTPDDILPNPEVMQLLEKLTALPKVEPSVISGRKLPHLQRLLPVKGMLLAGTYGIEIQTRTGDIHYRAEPERIRPILQTLKPQWEKLIKGLAGFYLEDKTWSLALHAKDACANEAGRILPVAESLAKEQDPALFRILGGHRFLEIAPRTANKGWTIKDLLTDKPIEDSILLYLGDDDKDEEAFSVVQDFGGYAVKVAPASTPTSAQFRLESPSAARAWLHKVVSLMET